MASEGRLPTWYRAQPALPASAIGTSVTTVNESPSGVRSFGHETTPSELSARRGLSNGFWTRTSLVPITARSLPLSPSRSADATGSVEAGAPTPASAPVSAPVFGAGIGAAAAAATPSTPARLRTPGDTSAKIAAMRMASGGPHLDRSFTGDRNLANGKGLILFMADYLAKEGLQGQGRGPTPHALT